MAEFRKLPTQAELQQMLFMESMRVKTPQEIAQENLAKGTTIKPIPENVFQKMAGGARTAGEFVNRAGTAADVAKLFPGYTGQSTVNIPTSFNFAPKQAPTGEIIPGGLQTQPVQVNQLLKAIKPADVLGISGAERAYTDVGLGKAPQPLDVLDVAGLGAIGYGAGKTALKATKGVPVGLSIQETKGLLETAPKSDIGFYSAVEQAALATPRKSGTGQAFLNDISKGQDVRADEIKWMGLDDFLKGKQNVTRQEVQDYIANNRVNVEEVALGDIKSTALYKEQSLANNLASLINKNEDSSIRIQGTQGKVFSDEALYYLQDGTVTPNQFPPELQNAATSYLKAYKEAQSATNTPSKFGQYTLPGGENYRELLLTMPAKQLTEAEARVVLGAAPDAKLSAADISYASRKNVDEYRSSHFDQPNILAHLRVNDRVDADGKKMLLIEEVQSDWHQAGRDKGYKALPEGAKIVDEDGWFEVRTKEGKFLGNGGNTAEEAKASAIDFLSGDRVPDAPFKDTWYQLALKRAIQHAAENGYDRIGLTTGARQAERFDLSKQVNKIDVEAVDEVPNLYFVDVDVVGGQRMNLEVENGIVRNDEFQGKPLRDVVGKEIADKILGVERGNMQRFEGDDLRIGGEGMKKYYDEIYPKFLDKYGKKWGARVGETKVNADGMQEPIRYIDITPEMKAGVSKGQPLFMAAPIGAGLLGSESMTPER